LARDGLNKAPSEGKEDLMKKNRSPLEIMIGPGIVIVLVLVGIGAWLFYRQPLGPALESSKIRSPATTGLPAPASAQQVTSAPVAAELPDAATTPESTPEPTDAPVAAAATSVPQAVCGETEVWNILVLGSDAADLYYPQGSDLTRAMRVDFPNKTVSIFAFSRDLWVDASSLGLHDPDINFTKLGMVFYEARRRSTATDSQDSMQDGVNAIAEVLGANFDLSFDHYIGLDLDKFPAMIDTVGGVPINIPVALTDPKSGISFRAGQQTLDGEQAATYARAYLGSDLNRIERNDLLLEALRQKMLDPSVWIRVPRLFIQFRRAINSDFSLEQVNHLVCLLREIEEEAIVQEGVLEEWTTPGPEDSLLWDEAQLFGRLEELGMIP
jgi:LCP family protein required for cell wall assembly